MVVHALEVEMGGRAECKVSSAYLWRGRLINDEPVFQPSVKLDIGEYINFIGWSSWDMTDQEGTWDRNRYDLSLTYSRTFGKHLLKAGAIAYIYHDSSFATQRDTYETFFTYILNVITLPTLRIYYDMGEYETLFAVFSLAGSKEILKDKIEFEWQVSAEGGDEKYIDNFFFAPANNITNIFGGNGWEFVDLSAVVQFPVSIGKGWSFIPAVTYFTVMDTDIKDALKIINMKKEGYIVSGTLEYIF